MVQEANHSLNQRRDNRDQEQIVSQSALIAIEMTKPWVRFQSDLMTTYANSVQTLARVCGAQCESLMNYGQESQSQYGQGNR